VWAPRWIILTDEMIYIKNEPGGTVRDVFETKDITHVKFKLDHQELAHTIKTKKRTQQGMTIQEPSYADLECACDESTGEGRVNIKIAPDADVADAEWENVVEIYSEHFGRTYYLKAASTDECAEWLETFKTAQKKGLELERKALNLTLFVRAQIEACRIYESTWAQCVIATLLMTNFIVNIIQTEIQPEVGSKSFEIFVLVDSIFTIIYVFDLGLNLLAHWFWEAFYSKAMWFDFIVVTFSLVDLFLTTSGANINVMRLFRIFRVVRIFNKFEDMRRILNANMTAFGPVLNAFLLLGVINAIYAVLGVNLFDDRGEDRFASFSLVEI
jgi:hypothetical protein